LRPRPEKTLRRDFLSNRVRFTLIERHLSDPRTGRNRQFPLADLFRQSIYSRLAGYEDTNDAERLAEDPTFRMLASRERRETSVALTSTLHWFETDVLAEKQNYQGLTRLNVDLVQHAAARSPSRRVTLDIDSSESPVQRAQEQSAYNGHFESVCYHPLFVFNPQGDCVAAKLRPGNVHSAEGWDEILWPSLIGTAGTDRLSWFGRTPHSLCRPSTRRWNA
jgi:Transposase DDE domain group 1